MDYNNKLANNKLQEILDKRGMSQQDLADLINYNQRGTHEPKFYQSDISDIIKGKVKRLTLARAAKISVAVGYSVEAIWPALFK